MRKVPPERTGWRDEGISRRHRCWGVSCAATDIDFLLVEYNYNTPKAIVEYKNEHAPPQRLSSSQYQVLRKLGDRAQIPILAARYTSDFSKFTVVPVNENAKIFLPTRLEMTESEFVGLLYRIRDINLVTADVIDAINGTGEKTHAEQLNLGI